MSEATPQSDHKSVNGLLLAALFIAGVLMLREGPHFDNVINGWPFFTGAFFIGVVLGFLSWSYTFGVAPSLKFSGSYRQPWLAALVMGLLTTISVSYINRTFAAPPDRMITGEVDIVDEGKGDRWHLTVKTPEGRYQRYLITKPVAESLKDARTVRMKIAHGALGFDFVAEFEPVRP
jgi:H+/Cl- antiporter ClcA